jgi:hypothetical protein
VPLVEVEWLGGLGDDPYHSDGVAIFILKHTFEVGIYVSLCQSMC